jgi:DNA polymerase I-like protein with 3'-5' exonuclease and polymerase domains
LDIECVEALSDALCKWEGTVLVVSHDQAFCESIGEFTHIATVSDGTFVLEEGSLRSSDWSQFESSGKNDSSDAVNGGESPACNREQDLDRKLQKQAYNAPKRIEKLEKLMEDLEVKVAAIDAEMLTNGSNVEKLMSLTHQREELQAKIDDYLREWEELEELLMSIM